MSTRSLTTDGAIVSLLNSASSVGFKDPRLEFSLEAGSAGMRFVGKQAGMVFHCERRLPVSSLRLARFEVMAAEIEAIEKEITKERHR